MPDETHQDTKPPTEWSKPTGDHVMRLMRYLHHDTYANPPAAQGEPGGIDLVSYAKSFHAYDLLTRLGDTDDPKGERDHLRDMMTDAPGMDVARIGEMVRIIADNPEPDPHKIPRFDETRGLVMDDPEAFQRHKEYLVGMLTILRDGDTPEKRRSMVAEWNSKLLRNNFPPDEQPAHIIMLSQLDALQAQLADIPNEDDVINRVAIMAHRGGAEVRLAQPAAEATTTAVAADDARAALEAHGQAEVQVVPQSPKDKAAVELALGFIGKLSTTQVSPDRLQGMVRQANEFLQFGNFKTVAELADAGYLPAAVAEQLKSLPPAPPPPSSPSA